MGRREVDVVVVGAGLAGLSAARAVLANGLEPLVLEGRDRIGGRTLNEPVGPADDQVVELGGQWVGPQQRRVMGLVRELGLETHPTYARGENLVEHRARIKRYTGTIPSFGPAVLADVGQVQARIDRMARTVPLDAPWRAPKALEWDRQTAWTWLCGAAKLSTTREILRLAIEAVWAQAPGDISLLNLLFYVHSAGGFDPLLDTEGGAQQDRIVGGSQRISLAMAQRLGEERIALEAIVRRVEQDDDGVTVHADGLDEAVRARRVIVAIAPPLAGRLVYAPALPALRDQMTQRMPMGSVIKCMAVYDTPFWRDEGLSGMVVSTQGPLKLAYDNSPPGGTPGVLLGFLEGDQARELAAAGPDVRRAAVLGCFGRWFGARARRPERYVDKSWADEELTRGCYAASFGPGGWTSFGRALRAPIGRIHWAGTETATVWNGYFDGAVSSGERAAAEVVRLETSTRAGGVLAAQTAG